MVTLPSNNKNGRNTIASNLLAPISFYLKMNSSLGLNDEKTSECDHDMMVHEVCYVPANACSQMYKVCLNPFDTGSVEQWLKFLTKLKLIITRNGLTASPAKFNLTWSLLKGVALQHFNNKAQELREEMATHHKMCLNMVSAHISPKNTLQMQKHYLRKVRLHGLITISEYFAHWCQLNDYLTLFPPHGRVTQKLKDDEIVELIYKGLPNCMQSDLKRMNEFDINNTNLTQFREVLEHLKLSYQLEKKMEKSKKSDTS